MKRPLGPWPITTPYTLYLGGVELDKGDGRTSDGVVAAVTSIQASQDSIQQRVAYIGLHSPDLLRCSLPPVASSIHLPQLRQRPGVLAATSGPWTATTAAKARSEAQDRWHQRDGKAWDCGAGNVESWNDGKIGRSEAQLP